MTNPEIHTPQPETDDDSIAVNLGGFDDYGIEHDQKRTAVEPRPQAEITRVGALRPQDEGQPDMSKSARGLSADEIKKILEQEGIPLLEPDEPETPETPPTDTPQRPGGDTRDTMPPDARSKLSGFF